MARDLRGEICRCSLCAACLPEKTQQTRKEDIELAATRYKQLKFIGSSEDDLAAFPKEAKGLAGNELWQVQLGLMPSDWKPILNVGAGAYEIRVHVLGEWRVIYVAKFADAVYVLHAFQKKTQQTRKEDIALAAMRYKQLKESAK